MSEKNFDILKNAEDDIIDELIPFSSDDEQTKKRVFEMSEMKFNNMMKAMGNNNDTDNEITVSGVEKYRRPVWYKPLCAAAALAVVVGGVGAVGLLNKTPLTAKGPAAQVEETAPTDTTIVTEANTESLTEVTSGVSAEAVTEDTSLAVINTSGVPTEDEMKAMFEEYLPIYMDIANLNAPDVVDTSAETISFWQYGGDDPDGTFDQSLWPDSKKEGTVIYDRITYYKLTDDRYSNLDEFTNYYDQYFAYKDANINGKYVYSGDLSEFNPDDTITNENSSIRRFDIIGYNGALYVPMEYEESEHPETWNNIISDRSYDVTENSFIWERVNKCENGEDTFLKYLDIEFTKCPDGTWKISDHCITNVVYEPDKDYSKVDEALIANFTRYGFNADAE